MTCNRRARSDEAADSQDRGPLAWWHRFRCEECRTASAADRLIERATAQMRGEAVPDDSLAMTLAAVGCPAGLVTAESRRAARSALARALALVGGGIFVTTLAQPDHAGGFLFGAPQYPTATAQGVAGFWALVGLFWYLKPVAALILEGVPGLLSRRRLCLLASALGAALLWLVPSLSLHASGTSRLILGIALNALLALASTILGGYLVEQAQRIGASGRLGALHQAAAHLAGLAAPLLGLTAGRAASPAIAPVLLAGFGILAALLMPDSSAARSWGSGVEGRTSVPYGRSGKASGGVSSSDAGGVERASAQPEAEEHASVHGAGRVAASSGGVRRRGSMAEQLRILAGARELWQVALLLLLVIGPSSFEALLTKQEVTHGFSPDQRLHLSWIAEAATLVSISAYYLLCRRVQIRSLLPAGILANAGGTLLYLAYAGPIGFATAALIEVINGLAAALIVVTLFDLAVRAVPRRCPYLGYAILMSIGNAAHAVSELATASLSLGFATVVVLSAACSALALLVVTRLPSALLTRREGEPLPGAAQWAGS